MSNALPSFGGLKRTENYYFAVDNILAGLRPASTLRVIAEQLTNAGFTSPTGKAWNRYLVSAYLRNRTIHLNKKGPK